MKPLVAVVIGIGLAVGWFFYWSPRALSVRTFNNLEENVRKVISASELQTWATNLLALYPEGTNLWASQLGTNFPPQLRKISPRLLHEIRVNHFTEEDGIDMDFVTLDWGGGILGHAGFHIGSTNFHFSGRKWKDGVYFIPAH